MTMKDKVQLIELLRFDKWGDHTINRDKQEEIRISVKLTSNEDSHHIQFPADIDRAYISFLLRSLADSIDRGTT